MIQKVAYTYDSYDNVLNELVTFNPTMDVDLNDPSNKVVEIQYPSYNYRKSLNQQRIDIDDDGVIDFHCYMEYDQLNRLVAIRAATGYAATSGDATLLVSYEHDDATGLIEKKKHYIGDLGSTEILINEIEYSYDVRDRLTNIQAGQMIYGYNPIMDYQISYDGQVPSYVDGTTTELVNFETNYNGNINGTVMRYELTGSDISNPITTAFQKPTLYGYSYDDINRLVEADGVVGDYKVTGQPGSSEIGDVAIEYDRIGNITSLIRNTKGVPSSGPGYMEEEYFNYQYATGNNRLEQATGMGTTTTRVYTYDANGNLLTDDYRNITGTEYGRAAYAYKLDFATDNVSYLYSIGDQRIYKKNVESSVTVTEDYYLHDAMGRTVAIYDMVGDAWNFYVSGSERECSVPEQVATEIVEGDATFYLYDHLGNTRITYTPVASAQYQIVKYQSNFSNSSTDGWVCGDGTITNPGALLSFTSNTSSTIPHVRRTLSPQLIDGTYQLVIDVDEGTAPGGLSCFITNGGTHTLVDGLNTINFTIANPTPGAATTISVFATTAGPYSVSHTFDIRSVTITYLYTLAENRIDYVADYFPYGKILRKFVNGDEERYLTTQHERDEETGLDYRGARYYDCDVARFLSLDPLASEFPSMSDYNYVLGNPIKLVDMDGKAPGEPEKKDPPQITASYFGIRRTQIGGNISTYLNTDFDYINPSSGQQFRVDEPSSFFELRYKIADNSNNIDFSIGGFRNHTKGGFNLPETETGKVHWGSGNRQIGLGGGFEISTPPVKGFTLSATGFLGMGPQFSEYKDADVSPPQWGIRGIGVVAMLDLNLKTPELGGIFSAGLSVRANAHHSMYGKFTVNDSGGTSKSYPNVNFTTAGITPTVHLLFNLSKVNKEE